MLWLAIKHSSTARREGTEVFVLSQQACPCSTTTEAVAREHHTGWPPSWLAGCLSGMHHTHHNTQFHSCFVICRWPAVSSCPDWFTVYSPLAPSPHVREALSPPLNLGISTSSTVDNSSCGLYLCVVCVRMRAIPLQVTFPAN